MKTLEELRARLGEIQARLTEIKDQGNFTEEVLNEVETLNDEFTASKKELEAREKIEEISASASTPKAKVTNKPGEVTTNNKVRVIGSKYDKTLGFKSMSEFAQGVANRSMGKTVHNFENSTAYEFIGEDGGVLVPQEFSSEIQKKVSGDESLMGLSRNFSLSSNHLSMPVDEVEPWNGGIQSYWVEEGGLLTKSKPKLGSVDFKLRKLGALVPVTDELLEDASALESYINQNAPISMTSKLNEAILSGDGAGKPEGLLGSGFTVQVAAEGGQAADTIVYENIVKMESRFIGDNGVYLAHPQVKEQLLQLKDANGNHIYMSGGSFPNLSGVPFNTLMGRRIIFLKGASPALGESGDLVLADMDYYYSAMKGGVKSDASIHLQFDRNITSFRFIMRVDGKCPFKSPLVTKNGAYEMSAFVKLAAR